MVDFSAHMISALVDKADLIETSTVVCFSAKQVIFFSLLPGDSAGKSFALAKKQLTAFVAD